MAVDARQALGVPKREATNPEEYADHDRTITQDVVRVCVRPGRLIAAHNADASYAMQCVIARAKIARD
jgi:hypothetical protein